MDAIEQCVFYGTFKDEYFHILSTIMRIENKVNGVANKKFYFILFLAWE